MLKSTPVATLLITSTLLAACSFNPFAKPAAKQNPEPATPIAQPAPENPSILDSPADNPVLSQSFSVFQEGKGRLTWQGQGEKAQNDRSLRAVSVSSRDSRTELAFEGTDGNLVRLSGTVVSHTPRMMLIDFTRSGDADASGSVRVKYDSGATNSGATDSITITSLTGNGILDGQAFAIEFGQDSLNQDIVQVPTPPIPPTNSAPQAAPPATTTSPSELSASPESPVPNLSLLASTLPSLSASPSTSAAEPIALPDDLSDDLPDDRLVRPDINMSQQGSGLFSLEGQAAKSLSSASIRGREQGRVDVVLRFADAEQIRFMGTMEQQDTGAIVVHLLNADTATAAGQMTVGHDGNHAIQTISGDGLLGTQPFSVQFSQ